MVSPDYLVDDDSIFLEPAPDCLQNNLRCLFFTSDDEGKCLSQVLLVQFTELVVLEKSINEMNYVCFVTITIDDLSHLEVLLLCYSFGLVAFQLFVLFNELEGS